MDFNTKHDGLERTCWFRFANHLPERNGQYEIRPWKNAPDTRCEWRDDQWWAADRIAHRLQVYEWRGITEASYLLAKARLEKASADA
jgi:hypothetical protein